MFPDFRCWRVQDFSGPESDFKGVIVDLFHIFVISFLCFSCIFVFHLQKFDVSKIINEKGCLEATEEWIERNMISLATCCFVVLFLQVSVLFLLFTFLLIPVLMYAIFSKLYVLFYRFWGFVSPRTYAPIFSHKKLSGIDSQELPQPSSTVPSVRWRGSLVRQRDILIFFKKKQSISRTQWHSVWQINWLPNRSIFSLVCHDMTSWISFSLW